MNCREVLNWIDGSVDAPAKIDANLFVATVHAMFSRAATATEDSWPVRSMLRYLLLRRDPTTNRLVELDFQCHLRSEEPERYSLVRSSCFRTIEARLNDEQCSVFPLLLWLQDAAKNVGRPWVIEEELSLLPLSLWLFMGNLSVKHLSTKRACLNMWKIHKSHVFGSVNDEFLHDKLDYIRKIALHLEFLVSTSLTTQEIVGEMNYLCWFCSLLRSVRMGLYDEVKEDLASELTWLRTETMSI